MELTGVIIDGAIPRTEYERCRTLVDYAELMLKSRDPLDLDNHDLLRVRMEELRAEINRYTIQSGQLFDWWHELEDNIIELINDGLPAHLACIIGEPEPGTVIVTEREGED